MRFLKNRINNRTTAIGVLAIVFSCISLSTAIAQTAAKLEIRTLSSRPDLVSGGDALVEVSLPAGVSLSQIKLTLNGKDVTNQLKDSGETRSARVVRGLDLLVPGLPFCDSAKGWRHNHDSRFFQNPA